jgi:hypothetical protein
VFKPIPLLLFAYNRPLHLKKTLEALALNEGADRQQVFIILDGAKKEQDKPLQEAIKEIVYQVRGFASVELIQNTKNLGLSGSIITHVTQKINEYGRVIVLEDDMETSPLFLRYMHEALEKYEHFEAVISIHAYVYPIAGLPSSFFLKGADCWGWATWKNKWALFNPNGENLLRELKQRHLLKRFDYNHSYGYTKMLKQQIAGKNQSWAVRWYASALLADKVTLYPGKSLVRNIGNDASGTHSKQTDVFDPVMATNLPELTSEAVEHVHSYKAFCRYFRKVQRFAYLNKIKNLFGIN